MTQLLANKMNPNEDYSQEIRVYQTMHLKAVRLHVYKQGTFPDIYVKLRVYDEDSNLLGTSTISGLDINTHCPDYWHGNISFEFDEAIFLSINPDTDYKVFTFVFRIEDEGILLEPESYISFCRDYEKYISNSLDSFKYPPLYGDETTDGITTEFGDQVPMGLELYELR